MKKYILFTALLFIYAHLSIADTYAFNCKADFDCGVDGPRQSEKRYCPIEGDTCGGDATYTCPDNSIQTSTWYIADPSNPNADCTTTPPNTPIPPTATPTTTTDTCTIQGYKWPLEDTTVSSKEVVLRSTTETELGRSTAQPFFFRNHVVGTEYVVSADDPDVIGSTLCYNATDCHVAGATENNPAFQAGVTRTVTCPSPGSIVPGVGIVDIYWHYTSVAPSPSPSLLPTAPDTSPIPEPGFCSQNASITLSAPPVDDAGDITVRVKFAGAFADNILAENDTQPLSITIIKQLAEPLKNIGLQTISSKIFETVSVTNTGEVDENGIALYEGAFTPTAIVPGSNYSVLVKGPYHLQRKFCEQVPTEDAEAGLPYKCSAPGQITLSATPNILDFSGVLLQAGDLPGPNGQDGVVNAYDVSLLLSILNEKGTSTETEDRAQTDMDFNGVVNFKDRSNIIETLEEKYGDEE